MPESMDRLAKLFHGTVQQPRDMNVAYLRGIAVTTNAAGAAERCGDGGGRGGGGGKRARKFSSRGSDSQVGTAQGLPIVGRMAAATVAERAMSAAGMEELESGTEEDGVEGSTC